MKMLIALTSQRLERFIQFYFFKLGAEGQGKPRLFLKEVTYGTKNCYLCRKDFVVSTKKTFHIEVTLRTKIM